MTRWARFAFVTTAALLLSGGVLPLPQAHSSDGINGIQLTIRVKEILEADPVESGWVDSVTYPIHFDLETSVRAGNFSLLVTAHPKSERSVDLTASLYVSGPIPFNRSDAATVEYGSALMIEDIRGKGKSHYTAQLIPHPASLPTDTTDNLSDTAAWSDMTGPAMQFYLPRGPLEQPLFLPYRGAMEYEYEPLRDSLGFDPSTRVNVYLCWTEPHDLPFEPGHQFAIDPARFRVGVQHSRFTTAAESRAPIMAGCLRWLGYAPALITEGIGGLYSFSDYDVKKDQDAGHRIPIDSLARTIDYRRYDPEVAYHHASSFIAWLINYYGIEHLRTLYDRATDLSIQRAAWSVYGHTIGELETAWLDFLKHRKFYQEELLHYADRERLYHHYAENLELLRLAAAEVTPPAADLLRKMALVQAHMGDWKGTVETLAHLDADYPNNSQYQWYLAEAERAVGDDASASRLYVTLAAVDSTAADACLRLGDIQWETRRADSAAALWKRGLTTIRTRPSACELDLRLGSYFDAKKHGEDSAHAHYTRARQNAWRMIDTEPSDPEGWILTAEALMGLDSADIGLHHLTMAESLSDAPVDRGRISLIRGQCYDVLRQRRDAIAAYDSVFTIAAEAPVQRAARRYSNRAYTR